MPGSLCSEVLRGQCQSQREDARRSSHEAGRSSWCWGNVWDVRSQGRVNLPSTGQHYTDALNKLKVYRRGLTSLKFVLEG